MTELQTQKLLSAAADRERWRKVTKSAALGSPYDCFPVIGLAEDPH